MTKATIIPAEAGFEVITDDSDVPRLPVIAWSIRDGETPRPITPLGECGRYALTVLSPDWPPDAVLGYVDGEWTLFASEEEWCASYSRKKSRKR